MSFKLNTIFFCGCVFSVLVHSDCSPAATILKQALSKRDLYSSTEIKNPVSEPSKKLTSSANAESEFKESTPQSTSENFNAIMNFGQDTFENTNQNISSEEDALKTSQQNTCRDLNDDLQIKLEKMDGSTLFRKQHAKIGVVDVQYNRKISPFRSGFLFKDLTSEIKISNRQ